MRAYLVAVAYKLVGTRPRSAEGCPTNTGGQLFQTWVTGVIPSRREFEPMKWDADGLGMCTFFAHVRKSTISTQKGFLAQVVLVYEHCENQ